jgi:Lrp/AsnC family transcriptional regulator, leucine-responsive regulatory protein
VDDIDRRILQLLQEDASRPVKVVAAAVHLSRSSVRERIARLQASGIIRRYTIDVAPPPGAVSAVLLVTLVRTPAPAVIRRIVACPEVFRCSSLSGEIDLLVEVAASEVAAINRIRDLIADDPGVADVVTSLVLNQDKSPADAAPARAPAPAARTGGRSRR